MSCFDSEEVPRSRKRNWCPPRVEEYSLRVFDLNHATARGWSALLHLNGGMSAECLTHARGTSHRLYMCCLVLNDEMPFNDETVAHLLSKSLMRPHRDAEWFQYASRIAIVVPVALQSGIAMAQGIKRLDKTCICDHLRGLGMVLLANVARHFAVEYMFMSPIGRFADHVHSELSARRVPFGYLGARSLWWAVTENDDRSSSDEESDNKNKWLMVKEGVLNYAEKGHFTDADVYFLKICPQPPFEGICRERTLLLNHSYYVPRGGHCDPEYEPPPHIVNYETHDFLWSLAGDGVLVIHGPSLRTLV